MVDVEKIKAEAIREYLHARGVAGGKAKSEKKAAASRENGRKGGRPPKRKKTE